jgi:hypothetical protein
LIDKRLILVDWLVNLMMIWQEAWQEALQEAWQEAWQEDEMIIYLGDLRVSHPFSCKLLKFTCKTFSYGRHHLTDRLVGWLICWLVGWLARETV